MRAIIGLIFGICLLAAGCNEESSARPQSAPTPASPAPIVREISKPEPQLVKEAVKEEEPDPPEVAIGERLFKETRFAQYFAAHMQRDGVNAPLKAGDPAVATTLTLGAPLPGPFAGQSMNCIACHLIDQHLETVGGGMRAYNDFSRRSLLSARGDGRKLTVRNTPQMVGISQSPAQHALFHFDGEFTDLETLAAETLSGRMMGWLPGERREAVKHIARVIREDDGQGALAQEFGGPYRAVLGGYASKPALVLPEAYRIDVMKSDDEAVLKALARLLTAYMNHLQFIKDADGVYAGSPYDHFLKANGLPRAPQSGEAPLAYARRLRKALTAKAAFVDEGGFKRHVQRFVFGAQELAGLKIFLNEQPADGKRLTHGVGNCIACHAPPEFTDYGLHNTGISQREYDQLHGKGAFVKMSVPGPVLRSTAARLLLPGKLPVASEPFRAIPEARDSSRVDLGAWNLVANPDFPSNQPRFLEKLCAIPLKPMKKCDEDAALPLSLATFKTPSLRDLGHSAPYSHAGLFDTLEDMVRFYHDTAPLARAGRVRNSDPRISDIALDDADVAALAAFLRALNEDYE